MKDIPQKSAIKRWELKRQLHDQQKVMLIIMICIMIITATVWLSYQSWRLLLSDFKQLIQTPSGIYGAVDLWQRYVETHAWFAGDPVYGSLDHAVYPPTSYALVAPFTLTTDFTTIRWLWAFMYIVSLAAIILLITRESGVRSKTAWIFVALIPLAMYATGAGIGNGQFNVLIIPLLIGSILLMQRPNPTWATDFLASLMMLFALVKPSIAAPFFWLILFIPGRLRPALLTGILYVVFLIVAAGFRDESLLTLIQQWLDVSNPSELGHGVSLSLHSASGIVYQLFPPEIGGIDSGYIFTFVLLTLTGVWVYRNRHADLWLLLGVVAISARLWTYHRWYDDILLLFPMIALIRIARSYPTSEREGVFSRVLFVLLWAVMLAPGLHFLPIPEDLLYAYLILQILIWFGCLLFFAGEARKERFKDTAGT